MSLRLRLLAAFGYVLLLVIVALEVPLALNLSRRVYAEVKSEAATQAQLLAASASGLLVRRERLGELAHAASEDLGGRVIVVDARGRLVADSAGSGLGSASYASRPEVRDALNGLTAQGTRHSNSLGEDLLYTAVPVVRAGQPAGAVRVTQSVDAVQRQIRRDLLALIGVGLIALLLGLAVAWLLAGSLVRPLRGLAATARRVAGGDLDERAEVSGSSEQREVAVAFNDMTGRLARALVVQREFVANASHQLRTPLTGLRLRLEAAGMKTSEAAVERDLAAAERETERLARLLSELLALAREGDRPEGERLALSRVAAEAHDRWEAPAAQTDHVLALDGAGDAAVVATAGDLAIVLDNLIENALAYSPAGTTVTVEWGADGRSAYLAVLDEGPGLDQGEEERAFERFYRGRASHGGHPGTGLGLSLVEKLTERWHGTCRLANRPTGGARAEVRLPAASVALPNLGRALDEPLPERG